MKFERSKPSPYAITAYGGGFIEIGGRRIAGACIISHDLVLTEILPPRFIELDRSHILRCLQLNPDIVLFGTGTQQRFADATTTRSLIKAGIGYEFMNTAAACRCYNVLIEEGRKVVAALFPMP